MKIRWAGHASFVIETASQKIITDPFAASYGYPLLQETADIVSVSHEHADHNATEELQGNPHVVKGLGRKEFGDIKINGYASWHDQEQGRLRGANTIFCFESEGMTVLHLGDLGHLLDEEQATMIKSVDILMIPIGSVYTINADEAREIVKMLQPSIVLPMHYATPHLTFQLDPLEKFTQHFEQVIYKPVLEIQKENLPDEMQIIILDYMATA